MSKISINLNINVILSIDIMLDIENLKSKVKHVDKDNFESLALEIFRFQYQNNKIYKQYVDLLQKQVYSINSLETIPFLPIQFYKSHKVVSRTDNFEKIYESSGTTSSVNSKNYVFDELFYFDISKQIFESQFGPLNQYAILALLPNYLERSNSSLVAMVSHFMKFSNAESGFYLNDFKLLANKIKELQNQNIKVILWGVTYALLDFSELYPINSSNLMIIETGGMKGRKKEMVRAEVHELLKQQFNIIKVSSEYGMTELFSQAYSFNDGIYVEPNSMKILIREVNDPFCFISKGRRGGINVIDLANIDTCSFIATQDLGIKHSESTFEVLGRFDDSDIRGCNLMVSSL